MLIWNANFQIPRSSQQTANVYGKVLRREPMLVEVAFYSDESLSENAYMQTRVLAYNDRDGELASFLRRELQAGLFGQTTP